MAAGLAPPFLIRLGAAFIDGLAMTLAVPPMFFVTFWVSAFTDRFGTGYSSSPDWRLHASQDTETKLQSAFFFCGLIVLFAAYHAICRGRTFGKSLAGIRVVSLDGSDIRRSGAVWRALACLLSFGSVVGYALAWRGNGRALHDHLAGTKVVTAGERSQAARVLLMALGLAGLVLFAADYIVLLRVVVFGPARSFKALRSAVLDYFVAPA